MAGVTFIRGKKADLAQRPIVNGQILFETDQEENNRVLMDIQNESGEDERIFFGGAIPDWVGTLAEYTQLPQTKLTDGKSYYIIDYPSDNSSVINDSTTTSTTKTWSANKLNTKFTEINSTLGQKSEASAVSGDTAFAKINSLNSTLAKSQWTKIGNSNASGTAIIDISSFPKRGSTYTLRSSKGQLAILGYNNSWSIVWSAFGSTSRIEGDTLYLNVNGWYDDVYAQLFNP